ncbi:MAG: 5'/3'-nucleotidase SurE [Bacteroidetes bacterium]|nr:MAG: 5'/3'-nucleotidase SurE [Bacteroidota bacterium]MBL1144533.1 5'/3'-nucleotidase SurE [Bacteroidota bacterium]MCB0802701.1 5'/3'-nucleotidase SurE [Flavobacteriales bacterium]NOG57328.1 5'/3'-nucleotidase SurE [Bacteroidota bacterium]
MTENPLILITNDDGISAPGILNLVNVAKKISNRIVVVAPDSPQSGMGHAITMNSMLRIKPFEIEGVEAYSCSGTPVDCVKIATIKVLKKRPDLVLSGINHGSNSSINVIYSGTMSAAVEASIEGIPAIGFSLCNTSIDSDFEPILDYVEHIIRHTLKNPLKKYTCLNVNFPAVAKELISGIKVCRQANAVWEENFDERLDPAGNSYFWLTGKFVNRELKATDTDEWALSNNFISIVPIHSDLTAYESLETLKSLENER